MNNWETLGYMLTENEASAYATLWAAQNINYKARVRKVGKRFKVEAIKVINR